MKYNFINLSEDITMGMHDFAEFHGFELGRDGIEITLTINNEKRIFIKKEMDKIKVTLPKEGYIFRAMTHIISRFENTYTYEEPIKFDTCGVMFDVSQANSLLNAKSCKLMLKLLSGMGYNMFMLYMEDCYVIDDEPYFGYMRPKYTYSDLKELDDYAYSLGIEMVPCIQTLGHLTDALKRDYPYGDFKDDDTTLLVGDGRTYELIEKMIKTASAPFRTKRIHIGLDEAFLLGQGKYLMKNGYRDKSEIMQEHLKKVYAITEKYNLKPMMWGDMFFRAKTKNNDYYNLDIMFDESDRLTDFPNLTPIYWDYYQYDSNFYEAMLQKTRELGNDVIFAGCSRNVRTFAAHHTKSVITTNPALTACKKIGVKEVFTTVWGDDNRESSAFTVLPDLMHFAEHGFMDEIPDEARCAQRFLECTHESYEAFISISALDEIPGYNKPNVDNLSPSKIIIWQDILLGIVDKDLGDFDFEPHYKELTKYFEKCKSESNHFYMLFDFYEKVSRVLELKSGIGRKLASAYKSGDRKFLAYAVKNILPDLYGRLKELHYIHRKLFMKCHKPVGWEILDIRYGGAIQRIDTAIDRIKSYLDEKCNRLEELEEQRLSFNNTNIVPVYPNYARLCSASRIGEKI